MGSLSLEIGAGELVAKEKNALIIMKQKVKRSYFCKKDQIKVKKFI